MFSLKLWSKPIRITILVIYLVSYILYLGLILWGSAISTKKVDPFVQAQQESAQPTKQN
jgi:hypothetical protein